MARNLLAAMAKLGGLHVLLKFLGEINGFFRLQIRYVRGTLEA